MLILRGRNLYPQDLERTTVEALGQGAGQCAAFSVPGPFGEELSLVAEVPRQTEHEELMQLARRVRAAIAEHHEADIRHLRLVRYATVPLTSSGKVQRSACRRAMQEGTLKTRFSWDRAALGVNGEVLTPPNIAPGADSQSIDAAARRIQQWLLQWVIDRAEVPRSDAIANRPFAEFGLDSLASVELSSELADWLGLDLSPVLAWNYPTSEKLSIYLANRLAGNDEALIQGDTNINAAVASDESLDVDPAELERLLDEVEQLSDDEINAIFEARMIDNSNSTVR